MLTIVEARNALSDVVSSPHPLLSSQWLSLSRLYDVLDLPRATGKACYVKMRFTFT